MGDGSERRVTEEACMHDAVALDGHYNSLHFCSQHTHLHIAHITKHTTGESKEPEGATVKFDETLRESSGGWVGGLSGRASLSGLWLTKDPPALVPAAVLPPACEFAPIRAMIGKIQVRWFV